MAYNPAIYNAYSNPYASGIAQQTMQMPVQNVPQQSFAPQMQIKGEIEWVDGEVGARAYQIPQGCTKPVALWDTNDTIIYLKSMNPMGMPNPLQKIHYKMEEAVPKYMGQSGTANLESGEPKTDYVRRDEMDAMKEELMQAIRDTKNEGKRTVQKGE